MRLVPILLLAAMLAFAGCFGKSNNDNPDGGATTPTDTTPAPTGGTTTTPSGTTPTSPTTGGNTTPPMAPAPKVVKSGSMDFTPSGPGSVPAPIAIVIDPGYTTLTLFVNFTGNAGGAGVAQGVSIKVGSVHCDIDGPVAPAGAPAGTPAPCKATGAATAGASKIEGVGQGAVTATFSLVES
jgi:hypothetical protein